MRLVVEYNGHQFSGWQVQPGQRTVQGELQKALETVLRAPLKAPPMASGRTDAGVSARRQVVTFRSDLASEESLHRIQVGVSSILKNELSILKIEEVDDDFHPVRDAIRKRYSYCVWNHPCPPVLTYGSCMHVVAPLAVEPIQEQARSLIGEHDFSSFRASGCGASSPVRVLDKVELERDGDEVHFRFVGKGFLKQMVRNLVGTLLLYGKEETPSKSIKEILEARDRTVAGPTAEPWGLTLDWVEYSFGRL